MLEGHRRRYVFLRALEMAHSGLTERVILAGMLELGQHGCDPPLAASAVEQQVRGAIKRAKKMPRTQKMLALEAEQELRRRSKFPVSHNPRHTRPVRG